MSNRQSAEQVNLDSILETLLPALPAQGDVVVTGSLAEILTDYFESKQIPLCIHHYSMADIMAGTLSDVPYANAVVISDFRNDDTNHRTVTIRLLGYLRDRSVAKILHLNVNTPMQPEWSLSDSLSMGFVRRAATDTPAMTIALDEFNIQSYKSEPDWLNAKNWAHPHLW